MLDPQLPIETDKQIAQITVTVIFCLIAIVAVGLRLLARRISHRALDASDYVMLAALVVNIGFAGLIAAEPFTGAGMHLVDVVTRYGMAPIVTYTKMTIANQILWALAVCLPKISVLLLYSRVFTMPIFITATYVVGSLIAGLGLATVLGALLQCQPFAYNWDQTIKGHCGDQVLSFKITGSLNVILDVCVLLLPMPYLLTLEMNMTKKAILVATFAAGFVTCIFSALRIETIVSLDYSDLTYLASVPSIYSVMEPCMAITLACVPVLRPLLGSRGSAAGSADSKGDSTVRTIGGTGGNSHNGTKVARSRTDKSGFQNLASGDDSSEYQLRPVGPKQEVHVVSGRAADGSVRSSGDEAGDAGITVKQEWEVKDFVKGP